MASVKYDQTGQKKWLVVVVMMRAPPYTSGQQDTPLSLVMEHQSQQGHHQDEDDCTADDSVGDVGVVAQSIVQRHKVLTRSFCQEEEKDVEQFKNGSCGWIRGKGRKVWRKRVGGHA